MPRDGSPGILAPSAARPALAPSAKDGALRRQKGGSPPDGRRRVSSYKVTMSDDEEQRAVEGAPGLPYRLVSVGLLERDEHLAVLLDRLERAKDAGRLVFIRGEAGAGKSALVQELRDQHLAAHR